jgi:uncharacterized protein YdhG (YjbR/CyaY superfamily)
MAAKTGAKKTVEAYIAAQPEGAQAILERVRSTLQKALPKAEEIISYSIPAFRLPGGVVIFFAGWKEHFSIYPATERVVASFRSEIAGYERSKGTIRFPYSEKPPLALIARIAKVRAAEVEERARSKTAKKKKAGKASRKR